MAPVVRASLLTLTMGEARGFVDAQRDICSRPSRQTVLRGLLGAVVWFDERLANFRPGLASKLCSGFGGWIPWPPEPWRGEALREPQLCARPALVLRRSSYARSGSSGRGDSGGVTSGSSGIVGASGAVSGSSPGIVPGSPGIGSSGVGRSGVVLGSCVDIAFLLSPGREAYPVRYRQNDAPALGIKEKFDYVLPEAISTKRRAQSPRQRQRRAAGGTTSTPGRRRPPRAPRLICRAGASDRARPSRGRCARSPSCARRREGTAREPGEAREGGRRSSPGPDLGRAI
jgi:hypothetical protein